MAQSGLPIEKFINTSGVKYRERGGKAAFASLSLEEKLLLLAEDGMLVKRPILVQGETVLVGFSPEKWAAALPDCIAKN